MNTINRALCRAWASTYNDVAVWAVSDKVKNSLLLLIKDETNKGVLTNAFYAVCNICSQMIDSGVDYRDIPNFPYTEACVRFKEMTYQYAQFFLSSKIRDLQWAAAVRCLDWGDSNGWDVISIHVNMNKLNLLTTLLGRTWNLFYGADGIVEKRDLYGRVVPKNEIITHQQVICLKESLVPVIQKANETFESDYQLE